MKRHFCLDSDDEAERCQQSFQGHTPIVVSGFDIMTGRIYSYSGVVLEVEPMESLGMHWRITIDTIDTTARKQPDSAPAACTQ